MARNTGLSQIAGTVTRGMSSGTMIADITNSIRELFVQSSMAIGIVAVMAIDMLLGGVSLYFMFDGVPLIPAHWLAVLFSVALSTVSYSMWKMLQKGTKYDRWLVLSIIFMVPLDMWVDLAIMELVGPTSGDVWLFLDPAALRMYPRPPLWWGVTFLVGLITLVNEPLTAVLTKSMKQNQEWKNKYPSKKPQKPPQQSRHTQAQGRQARQIQSRPPQAPVMPSLSAIPDYANTEESVRAMFG